MVTVAGPRKAVQVRLSDMLPWLSGVIRPGAALLVLEAGVMTQTEGHRASSVRLNARRRPGGRVSRTPNCTASATRSISSPTRTQKPWWWPWTVSSNAPASAESWRRCRGGAGHSLRRGALPRQSGGVRRGFAARRLHKISYRGDTRSFCLLGAVPGQVKSTHLIGSANRDVNPDR